jgi:hypothetical protein
LISLSSNPICFQCLENSKNVSCKHSFLNSALLFQFKAKTGSAFKTTIISGYIIYDSQREKHLCILSWSLPITVLSFLKYLVSGLKTKAKLCLILSGKIFINILMRVH